MSETIEWPPGLGGQDMAMAGGSNAANEAWLFLVWAMADWIGIFGPIARRINSLVIDQASLSSARFAGLGTGIGLAVPRGARVYGKLCASGR